MADSWRNWYLGSLGVVRYVPRDLVEEVAEEEFEQPPVSAPVVSEPAATPIERGTAEPSGIEHLPEKVAEPAPKVPPAAPVKAQAPADNKEEEILQCRLAFWQPCAQLVVLSAMPPGVRPGQSQQAMLTNLLTAIHHLEGTLPQAELLDWPLAPGTDSTLRGARDLLAAFLDVKHQLKPFRSLLLMGSDAVKLVAAQEDLAIGSRVTLACKAEAIVTHSLHEMDQDKSLKRPTWEAIRFLAEQSG